MDNVVTLAADIGRKDQCRAAGIKFGDKYIIPAIVGLVEGIAGGGKIAGKRFSRDEDIPEDVF
jgi:hypothetical protein